MAYTFKGRLCGFICSECSESLANIVVRLYRSREGQNVTALAVANPKDTFAILTDEAVKEKASALIAETETDEQGNFTFELGEQQQYNGEAFEIDGYCGTLPHHKIGPNPHPVQFSITTLQPQWRKTEAGPIAAWEYCLPYRFWCAILALFDAWTICGRVTTCDTQKPVSGVTIRAFDADWLQDDDLGSAITDGAGKFRIDYTTLDFQKTIFSPLINIEWIGGPDLYFRVEAPDSSPLLVEPQARGRQPDRENAGHCFCVELCIGELPLPPFYKPRFTEVGDFHRSYDVDSTTTGLTNKARLGHGGPGYGFFGDLQLGGFCPKTLPADPSKQMRYRFLYIHPDNPAVEVALTGVANLVAQERIGYRLIQWDLDGSGATSTVQPVYVDGSGATLADPTPSPLPLLGTPWGLVPDHVIVPDANGWITVDQNMLDGGLSGTLIGFRSYVAVPATGPLVPLGYKAGDPLAAADQKNGVAITLIFQAEAIDGTGTVTEVMDKILINNWPAVHMHNLQQFLGGGAGECSELSGTLDILYSADHELMAEWGIRITSASPSAPGAVVPPFPLGSTARGGIGTLPTIDISTWQSCSYLVWLDTRRKLTDGRTPDPTARTLVPFCK